MATSARSVLNLSETLQEFMRDGWAERDPRLTRAAALNHAGFIDSDILTDEEIATNDVYANFYRKHGVGYMAGTLIPNPSGDSIGFAFQRHQDSGPVPRETIVALDRLRPHLARASMIAFRGRCCAGENASESEGIPRLS